LSWTFVALLVSPYFVDDVWQKLRQWQFSKVIRQNIVVYFPQEVRDNVVSDDHDYVITAYRCDSIRNKFSTFLVK